ncbi:peptide ABC transporter substrate-binding protein [Brevibacillus choshinensis]|uniref:Peptide ABC transporter substrate-binding protein n=1 Tax=Brevibacillus choshinensis TaxID=54911 RepID=A0ABR5NEK4_BRECH|nr:ABC transporter substrate-binding protein [Brevibacillus choshinensis]KQL49963.1 peptide ABC transporter substrate-binding protein [Brevibacillus choshinensis]
MKRNRIAIFLIVAMLLSLIGCSSSTSSPSDTPSGDGKTEGKKELRVATSTAPPTLDLLKTTTVAAVQISWNIFESLVTMDENYQVAPMMAKSIDVSQDGKTITFPLREGLKFHNGKEVTAEDVVASLTRWKELSNNGRAALTKAKVTAKDAQTVEIALGNDSPSSAFILSSLAFPQQGAMIMPKEVIEAADEKGVKEYIGSGPFKFVEWKQDQYIHLQKFSDYKPSEQATSGRAGKKEVSVDDLYFIPVTDAATRVAGLQSGEYDFADDIPIDNYNKLKEDPNIETMISKPRRWNGIVFNTKSDVFSNIKARQAVNAGLDLDEIMMAATGNPDFYRVDHGLMYQEQSLYVDAGKENYNQKNLDKAKKLLAEAGYQGQTVTILGTRDYEFLYKTAVVVKAQMEKMGINVNLEIYDFPTLQRKTKEEKGWEMYFTYFPIYMNPTQPIFLDSRNKFVGQFNDPKMDQLLDKYRLSNEASEQKEIFKEIQALFWEDVPVIKLGDMFGLLAYRNNVKGYKYFYDISFWNVSVE